MNQFYIALGLDNKAQLLLNRWYLRSFDEDKTEQENMGFSNNQTMNNFIESIHGRVQKFATLKVPSGNILDIGCGSGLYLDPLQDSKRRLFGIDLCDSFLNQARKKIPEGIFFQGDFLDFSNKDTKFSFILSIGALEYIVPSKIGEYFDKVYELLDTNGYIFIVYPHALSLLDYLNHKIEYISYSPEKLEAIVKQKFHIEIHEHAYDRRIIKKFDDIKYDKHMPQSFRNSYLLIARKAL